MIKVSLFQGETEYGPSAVPLFGPSDTTFEKVAAPSLLPEVSRYIASLRPVKDSIYVLVNAMGACEFYGSNVNGDAFTETSLIHAPDDWKHNPLVDKIRAKEWPYGYPTFYLAHPYAHHRNKDATRAFGEVELAAWNPRMKRVELVTRVDREKCHAFGGVGVWDKLQQGQFPDVSMGTKVPFDTCSICLDWKAYRDAQATFDPKKHKSQGDAVLEVHKKLQLKNGKGIRGVSITRKDYCDHASKMMNKILPDGRKVFVYNDYPKFFDISFVFIGADRTAKVMLKIAGDERKLWSIGSAELAEKLGYDETTQVLQAAFVPEPLLEKAASAEPEDGLKTAFLGKAAKDKQGEITKDVVPSQFASKAVPILTKNEPHIPDGLLDLLGKSPLEEALSTPTSLGIVLRPREFQRIMLIQIGHKPLADKYDREGVVFPKSDEDESVPMGPEHFSPVLARLLSSLIGARSGFGPSIEKRVLILSKIPTEERTKTSSLSSNLLRKIGAAYNGYRKNVMELVAHSQEVLMSSGMPGDGYKFAHAPVGVLFTPLAVQYFDSAFQDEIGTSESEKTSSVERGFPSRNTSDHLKAGGQT
jgi:hypothetical protein